MKFPCSVLPSSRVYIYRRKVQPSGQKRAVILYTILSDEFSGYDHAVNILDIDGTLTVKNIRITIIILGACEYSQL